MKHVVFPLRKELVLFRAIFNYSRLPFVLHDLILILLNSISWAFFKLFIALLEPVAGWNVVKFDPALSIMILGNMLCVKCERTGGTLK